MGILSSTSNAICNILDAVADVGDASAKAIGMATTYVSVTAKAQKLTLIESTKLSVAKEMRHIQEQLDEDEKLAQLFADLDKEFA